MLSYLPTLTLLATTAFSLPTTTNTTTPSDLAPWQLTTLNTHVPSGRPGNSPYTTLNLSIASTTPSSSAASCSAQWIGAAEFPVGVDTPCTTTSGDGADAWRFAITDGTGASDFALRIELLTQAGQRYVAQEKFAVGDNLSGVCGGSGVCNWGLKSAPYEVQQEEVEGGDEE